MIQDSDIKHKTRQPVKPPEDAECRGKMKDWTCVALIIFATRWWLDVLNKTLQNESRSGTFMIVLIL